MTQIPLGKEYLPGPFQSWCLGPPLNFECAEIDVAVGLNATEVQVCSFVSQPMVSRRLTQDVTQTQECNQPEEEGKTPECHVMVLLFKHGYSNNKVPGAEVTLPRLHPYRNLHFTSSSLSA